MTLTRPAEHLMKTTTLALLIEAGLVLVFAAAVLTPATSAVKTDEEVVFYPTYAHLDEDGTTWTVPIHGLVFEPNDDSLRSSLAVAALRRELGVEPDTPEARIFDRRLRLFTVDHERRKVVPVRIGDAAYTPPPTGPNGHFQGNVQLADDEARRILRQQGSDDGRLRFSAVLTGGDDRSFAGEVHLIGRSGWSLISDLDDTIKITNVRDRKAMLTATFLREFQPVPGMAELYRELARQGVAVHYVSGSPWQLYEPLSDFRRKEGFPASSFHLKHFRLTDPSVLKLLGPQQTHKLAAIEPILTAFPERRFILVGDSGEHDPEIYGKLARKYPAQIAAICIRNVTGETADNRRMQAAFKGIERQRWTLFQQPEEIRALLASPWHGTCSVYRAGSPDVYSGESYADGLILPEKRPGDGVARGLRRPTPEGIILKGRVGRSPTSGCQPDADEKDSGSATARPLVTLSPRPFSESIEPSGRPSPEKDPGYPRLNSALAWRTDA